MKKTAIEGFEKKESPFARYDESGKRVVYPEFNPSLLNENDSSEATEEKEAAPVAQPGTGGSTWGKVSPNTFIKYEVPSFDRGGSINVLVSGKMPYTLGHHVQFNGILESAGIGDIFTMDHELISSLRKFVYQEMPKVDQFSKDMLDKIYSDAVADVGMNVPIKSIYTYLKENYPKEFSRATGGRPVDNAMLSDVISKQRAFYSRGRIATQTSSLAKTAQWWGYEDEDKESSLGAGELKDKTPVSVSYQELEKIDRNLAEKIKASKPVKDFFVTVKDKGAGKVLIVGKDALGKQLTYIVPKRALKKYKKPKSLVEMQRELDEGLKKQKEGNKENAQEPLQKKFFNNEKMSNAELKQLFIDDVFSAVEDQQEFNNILNKSRYKKTILKLYPEYSGNLSEDSRNNFIGFKSSQGVELEESDISSLLQSLSAMDYEEFKAKVDSIKDKPKLFDLIAKNESGMPQNLIMNVVRYKVSVNPRFLNDREMTMLLKNYKPDELDKNKALMPIIVNFKLHDKNYDLSDAEAMWVLNNHGEEPIGEIIKIKPNKFALIYKRAVKDSTLQNLPFDFKKYMMAWKKNTNGEFTQQEMADPAYKAIFSQPEAVAAKLSHRQTKISKREN